MWGNLSASNYFQVKKRWRGRSWAGEDSPSNKIWWFSNINWQNIFCGHLPKTLARNRKGWVLPSLLKGGEPSRGAAVLNVGYILQFWWAITRKRIMELKKEFTVPLSLEFLWCLFSSVPHLPLIPSGLLGFYGTFSALHFPFSLTSSRWFTIWALETEYLN